MKDDFTAYIPQGYTLVKTIRSSDRGGVCIVKGEDGEEYFCRVFEGTGEVYRALYDAACPHIPKPVAYEEKDGLVRVVEEYVRGDSLDFLLRAAPLTEEQAVSVARQLCDALETLHRLGVVHRDIKPENILLRGSEAVLVDFDASRMYKPESSSDTHVMGTTGYAAPEQYGFTQTDGRADIYALGILLNEMLTRSHPSRKLAEGPLRPVIEKCIEVNMDKRYPTVSALRDALDAAEAGAPSGKRRRGLIVGLIAAAAAVCVLAAVLLPRTISPAPEEAEAVELQGFTTEFSYDLDGDGRPEDYLFGVGASLPGTKPGNYDYTAVYHGNYEMRTMAPCVWQWRDDEGYVTADAFAPLLENASITLTAAAPLEGSTAPAMEKADPFLDIWEGAVYVEYREANTGSWMFTARAELDGQSLEGAIVTTVEPGEE